MRTGTKKAIAAAVLVGLSGMAATSRAGTISVNFDTPGQFTGQFNQFQQVVTPGSPPTLSPNPFTENSAGGGVSGTGSVTNNLAAGQDGTATYNLSGLDFSTTGATVSESIIFKTVSSFTATNTTSGQRFVQLGFLTTNSGGFNGNSNQTGGAVPFPAFMSARVSTVGNGASGGLDTATSETANVQFQQKLAATAGAATLNTGTNFQLSANEFYQLTINATQSGGGAYAMTASLLDMGADGATPGTLLVNALAATGTTGIPDLATTVYGGFRATATDGTASYDNFSETGTIVSTPEPASVGLLGLGSLAMLARRRRRGQGV